MSTYSSLIPIRNRCRTWYVSPDGMPLRLVGAVVLVLGLLGAGGDPSAGQPTGASIEEFARNLDARVPALMRTYDVPGVAMALVRADTVAWVGAYGEADVAAGRSMTVDAVFRVESISKSVTAWGVMRLVEEGRIELNAPVDRYLDDWSLPDTRFDERKVTVRRLLSHTAGVPLGPIGPSARYRPGHEMPSLQQYLAQEARLVRRPGSRFSYSNAGLDLLQLVIEDITGRDFPEYMADEVLTPLRMSDATFGWTDTLRPRLPSAYVYDDPVLFWPGSGRRRAVPPYVYPGLGAGGLFASVEAVAQFVSAEVRDSLGTGDRVLDHESRRRLHTAEVDIPGLYGVVADAYGLGHFVETLFEGDTAVWHGGRDTGG